jgi:hypothetical protein
MQTVGSGPALWNESCQVGRPTEEGVQYVVSRSEPVDPAPEPQSAVVEETFKQALIKSHRSREFLGEVEAAAAHFCRALRRQGVPPERMLVDAKRVIEEAIDGDDVPIAERAVESCIRHYYRAD